MKKNNQSSRCAMLYLDTRAAIARLEETVRQAEELLPSLHPQRAEWTRQAIRKWQKTLAVLRQMPDRAPCGSYFDRVEVLPDYSKGIAYCRSIIATPQDREEHIGFVAYDWYAWYDQARIARPQKTWPENPSVDYLESVGDSASVNTWRAHNSMNGFEVFKADTPDWVVEIARRRKWITRKIGEGSHVSQ